jgi:hypothetical protein
MIEIETSLKNEPVREETYLEATHRVDKRQFSEKEYNKFVKLKGVRDWSTLTWKDVGKPYEVTTFAKEKNTGNGRMENLFLFIHHGKCLTVLSTNGL